MLGMTLAKLADVVFSARLPRFAASQIARWIYKQQVISIGEMTNLSKKAREALELNYIVGRKNPVFEQRSIDGTIKYLFKVGGNRQHIESVFIPDKQRATLCVSSQIGCRMNCRFCMTGRQGFHGNLSTNEILNQILSIPQSRDLTNIVFMGMGEPLDNIDSLLETLEIMTAEWGLAWSPRRITVSSIGKLDNLKRLLTESEVHVAISLHSPFAEERARLMPIEKAFPIARVIDFLSSYDFKHQRRCSIEYIIWNGLNDDRRHADELAKLLKKIPGVRVNLIRFHAIPNLPDLQPASQERMERFRDWLNEKGILATIRSSRGEDIMAACGLLSGMVN